LKQVSKNNQEHQIAAQKSHTEIKHFNSKHEALYLKTDQFPKPRDNQRSQAKIKICKAKIKP